MDTSLDLFPATCKWVVKPITYQQAKALIIPNHYSHRMPTAVKHSYGLFEGGLMVGAITFGRPSSPQVARSAVKENLRSFVLELSRLVITVSTPNAASKLIGLSLRLLPRPFIVVSFADKSQSHVGYVYQATNFFFAGESRPHDSEYIIDGKRVHPRTLAARGITSPRQWAREHGIQFVPIEPKYRYLFYRGIQPSEILWSLSRKYPKGNLAKTNVEA